MQTDVSWVLGAYAVLLALFAIGSRVRDVQTWQLGRLASQVGLGVPQDLESKLRGRVSGRILGIAFGGLLGLAGGWALADLAPAQPDLIDLYWALGASAAGSALGQAWASFSQTFTRETGPRIARVTDVTLGSYVPLPLRILAAVLVALTIATVVVAVGSDRLTAGLPAAPLIGVSVLSLVSVEVLGRRLVKRRQVATTTDELAWDDALRSACLNGVTYSAQSLLIFEAAPLVALGARDGYWALLPGGLLAVGAILFAAMYMKARTWYLAELWPGSRRRTPEEEEARLASRA
jgi:hypothetical protein